MNHHVTVTIDPGDTPRLQFHCDEPADSKADCHTYCSGDCETWCRGDDEGTCGYCGQPLEHTDECQIRLFDDLSEGFAGAPDTPCVAGPVEFMWTGDYYEWKYAAAAQPEPLTAQEVLADLRNNDIARVEFKYPDAVEGYVCRIEGSPYIFVGNRVLVDRAGNVTDGWERVTILRRAAAQPEPLREGMILRINGETIVDTISDKAAQPEPLSEGKPKPRVNLLRFNEDGLSENELRRLSDKAAQPEGGEVDG